MHVSPDWFSRFRSPHGRETAFRELIETYQQRLYAHVFRLLGEHNDADEALQLTFIKAWKGLDNFREDSRLYTWLYRIATNEALNLLKQRKKLNSISMDDEEYAEAEPYDDTTPLPAEKVERWLNEAIESLPPKQRLVFNLKYFDELKFEEMAEVTGTSVGALKASYHHAVRKIENYIRAKAV